MRKVFGEYGGNQRTFKDLQLINLYEKIFIENENYPAVSLDNIVFGNEMIPNSGFMISHRHLKVMISAIIVLFMRVKELYQALAISGYLFFGRMF